jgi:hypothetical protein
MIKKPYLFPIASFGGSGKTLFTRYIDLSKVKEIEMTFEMSKEEVEKRIKKYLPNLFK